MPRSTLQPHLITQLRPEFSCSIFHLLPLRLVWKPSKKGSILKKFFFNYPIRVQHAKKHLTTTPHHPTPTWVLIFIFSFVAVAFGLKTPHKTVNSGKIIFSISDSCSTCLEAPYNHTSSPNSDLSSHVQFFICCRCVWFANRPKNCPSRQKKFFDVRTLFNMPRSTLPPHLITQLRPEFSCSFVAVGFDLSDYK